MSTRRIKLEDGTDFLLLEDGTNALLKEGVAQATDDVLLRFGPSTSTTDMSGLITSAFSAVVSSGGGTVVNGAYYYTMMNLWFASN